MFSIKPWQFQLDISCDFFNEFYVRLAGATCFKLDIYIRIQQSWNEGCKVTFEALSAKTNIQGSNVFLIIFYQCCSNLDWLYNAFKTGFLLYNEYQSSLFLLGFSIGGQGKETKAANNTASTFLEHAHIINHMHTFKLHKCTCANIKMGVAVRLRIEEFSFECIEGSKL